jgi:hypothetical protein
MWANWQAATFGMWTFMEVRPLSSLLDNTKSYAYHYVLGVIGSTAASKSARCGFKSYRTCFMIGLLNQ